MLRTETSLFEPKTTKSKAATKISNIRNIPYVMKIGSRLKHTDLPQNYKFKSDSFLGVNIFITGLYGLYLQALKRCILIGVFRTLVLRYS